MGDKHKNNENKSSHNSNKRKKIDDNNDNNKIEKQNSSAQNESSSKKKNRKEVAIFGNYRNYYGYRVGQDLEEDPRLKVMKREWFEGKDCLDIGCNSGLITISIAKKFDCRSILGVDIDGARIEDAYWTLRKVMRMMSTGKMTCSSQRSGDDQLVNGLESDGTKSQENCGESPRKDLSEIVSFEKGNFVLNWRPPQDKLYDTIICLSVSKWVQLNWGDDGLITLFSKVWRLLRPGGIFILEPQPWSSYYNNRLISETAASNYKNIQIPPEDFQDLLLDKIGFRRVENITSVLPGTKCGFNRPILAFWK